jgi:hypothetical protein
MITLLWLSKTLYFFLPNEIIPEGQAPVVLAVQSGQFLEVPALPRCDIQEVMGVIKDSNLSHAG